MNLHTHHKNKNKNNKPTLFPLFSPAMPIATTSPSLAFHAVGVPNTRSSSGKSWPFSHRWPELVAKTEGSIFSSKKRVNSDNGRPGGEVEYVASVLYSYSRQIEDSHRRPMGQHPPRRELGQGKVWPGQKNLGEGIFVVVVVVIVEVLVGGVDDKILG